MAYLFAPEHVSGNKAQKKNPKQTKSKARKGRNLKFLHSVWLSKQVVVVICLEKYEKVLNNRTLGECDKKLLFCKFEFV